MVSSKFWVASTALLAALPGCGSSESGASTPPLGMDEAPVLADAALSALSLRGALIDGQIHGSGGFYDPGHGYAVPAPVADTVSDMNIAPTALSKCVVQASPWIDADKDGIPVEYTITFGCNDQLGHDQQGNAFNYVVLGAVTVDDSDDANAKSGYTMHWAGFGVQRVFLSSGVKRGVYLDGALGIGRDTHGLSLIEAYNVRTTIQKGEISHTGVLENAKIVAYTPDDAAAPFAAGTVGWLEQTAFTYDNVTHRLTTKTDPTLHFNDACRVGHPGRPGWDGGAVTFADGATLRIQYVGCDGTVATLDGMPVPL